MDRHLFDLGQFGEQGAFGCILLQASVVAAGTWPAADLDNGMTEFSGVAIFSFYQLVFHNNAYTDTGMNADIQHLIGLMTERPFAQNRKVGFVFHQDRDLKGFCQRCDKIQIFIGRIRKENDPVVMYYAVNAKSDPQKTITALRKSVHCSLNISNQGRNQIRRIFRKLVLINMAVASQETCRHQSNGFRGKIQGNNVSAGLIHLQ